MPDRENEARKERQRPRGEESAAGARDSAERHLTCIHECARFLFNELDQESPGADGFRALLKFDRYDHVTGNVGLR
eukprot:COSAG06_NODE_6039_length_3139_cov_16.065789_2_plen_76_part_00